MIVANIFIVKGFHDMICITGILANRSKVPFGKQYIYHEFLYGMVSVSLLYNLLINFWSVLYGRIIQVLEISKLFEDS